VRSAVSPGQRVLICCGGTVVTVSSSASGERHKCVVLITPPVAREAMAAGTGAENLKIPCIPVGCSVHRPQTMLRPCSHFWDSLAIYPSRRR